MLAANATYSLYVLVNIGIELFLLTDLAVASIPTACSYRAECRATTIRHACAIHSLPAQHSIQE